MTTPQPDQPANILGDQVNDDLVIDLTDAAVASGTAGIGTTGPGSILPTDEEVLDLRDLTLAGRHTTAGPMMSGRPPELPDGYTLLTITGGDRWMEAEAFVYERYVTLGYTGESDRRRVEESARWADRSKFFAMTDEQDRIVGTIRSIVGTYDQLPVGQFERTDFDDADPLCELASIVVDKSVGGSGVLEHLFRAGWADSLHVGAGAILGLVDRWLLDVFRDVYAMPFVPIGIPHYHMGGNVIPVTMSTSRAAVVEMARNNPEFVAWNFEVLSYEELERYDLLGLVETSHAPSRT